MLPNQSFNWDLEPSSSSVSSCLDTALLYHIYLLYYPKRKRKGLKLQQGTGNTRKPLSTTISIPPTTYNTPPANAECQRVLSCPPLSSLTAKSPKYCWKSQRYTDRKHDISLPNAARRGGISPPSARHEGTVLLVSVALPQEVLRAGGRCSRDTEHQAPVGKLAGENVGAPRLNKLPKEMANEKRVLKTEILKVSSPAIFSPLRFVGWQCFQALLLPLPVFEPSPAPTSPTRPFSLLASPTSG